jgi:hypothetical protein
VLDEAHSEKKRGALTVLALFIAVLLGQSGVASAAELDARGPRLGQSDPGRSTAAALRTIGRSAGEEADADDALAILPAGPKARRDIISARAAGEGQAFLVSAGGSPRPVGYRARAPPAA